jgi:hypothetical protein
MKIAKKENSFQTVVSLSGVHYEGIMTSFLEA